MGVARMFLAIVLRVHLTMTKDQQSGQKEGQEVGKMHLLSFPNYRRKESTQAIPLQNTQPY